MGNIKKFSRNKEKKTHEKRRLVKSVFEKSFRVKDNNEAFKMRSNEADMRHTCTYVHISKYK